MSAHFNCASSGEDWLKLVQLENLARNFGGVQALAGVSATVDTGEIVGLMGDNGAGKSTLVRIIAGSLQASSGTFRLEDHETHFSGPAEARRAGIEIVYQDLALCNNLSAVANVFLGRERTWGIGPIRFLDHRAMRRETAALFQELHSETRPHDVVHRMSGGQRQAVAIARTRLARPKLVLMDEPTAAISVRQVAQVLDLIRRLKASGLAVILISHRMPDIFAVCDRVIVLRRGSKVADLPIASTNAEEITGLITGAIERR